jgi:hypothetical protein
MEYRFKLSLMCNHSKVPAHHCSLHIMSQLRARAQLRPHAQLRECNICSYRQISPVIPSPVFHSHNSAREVRILQGVEYVTANIPYMCTTCITTHPARPELGLNVCLSTSQLHNIHTPRSSSIRSDPDPIHIDWLTVCGATIAELEYAWVLDYKRQPRPMRILLSAGLTDLAQGRSRNQIVESIIHFKQTVDKQNMFHPNTRNELVIATVLNPPKFVWFDDNGPPPLNHRNMLADIKELNSWIVFYNKENGKDITPRFHRFGVKDGWVIGQDGKRVRTKRHIQSQWRQSEPVRDRMHLSDTWRVRLGRGVTRHFQGELERHGVLS